MFGKISLIFGGRMLMSLFFLAALKANALTYSSATSGETKRVNIDVQIDHVNYNGKKFYFDQEKVIEAYGISSTSLFGPSTSDCKAETTQAKKISRNTFILLETVRSKTSKSYGVLCSLAKDVSQFRNPHYYVHTVLKLEDDGRSVSISELVVMDGAGRPNLSTQELLQENVLNSNRSLAAYIELSQGGPYPKATFGSGLFTRLLND